MDPRDDLDSLADGVDCAACGVFVPTDRIRVLARRDDIAFVEIHCPACRSESLGIVIAPDDERGASDGGAMDDGGSVAVGPGLVYGEFGPRDEERFREALPIGSADLDLVQDLLARGGLSALVGGCEPPAASSGR
ncbi:MAG: hypothetical protein ABIZ72_05795 [Candidatus Limnocylindrales bacterium]